mmetsp:Transcript_41438/g.69299  ORF Transcript_41438/g.69299 Transcript_41438/m.69299 type:complete len:203 (-) Transcript_41438:154-762(-)
MLCVGFCIGSLESAGEDFRCGVPAHVLRASLHALGGQPALARADAHHLQDRRHENFAVPHLPSVAGFRNNVDHFLHLLLHNHDLNLDLFHEGVFAELCAVISFNVRISLKPDAFHFIRCQASESLFLERRCDVGQPPRPDDRVHLVKREARKSLHLLFILFRRRYACQRGAPLAGCAGGSGGREQLKRRMCARGAQLLRGER